MPNYILLERIELNASAASVTFSNIPQSGYTDLKLVMSLRSARVDTDDTIYVDFNSFAGTNLSQRRLEGNGASASSSSASLIAFRANAANNTASTFTSAEIYLPNYTTSSNKSMSIDSAFENNSTTAYLNMVAGLWSSSSAITAVKIYSANSANLVQYSTFSLYGLAAVGTTPVIAPKASGGDIIENDGTYWIHTFFTTGAFVPQQGLTCDYLVVAGGGGSGGVGANLGAGGGAGGLRSTVGATGGGGSLESPISVSGGTSYTITVGAGGATSATGTQLAGVNGSNSVFSTITSTGGGGGGTSTNPSTTEGDGKTGGSGGGAGLKLSGTWNLGSNGSGTANQGYAGGGGVANVVGGGGGGAGEVGGTDGSGHGGDGVATSISGTSVTYAGGGGGGSGTTGGTGGTGGGGNGGSGDPSTGISGTANTGGGGGGGRGGSGGGGNGGSGVVIIRYPIA